MTADGKIGPGALADAHGTVPAGASGATPAADPGAARAAVGNTAPGKTLPPGKQTPAPRPGKAFQVRKALSPRVNLALTLGAFLLPMLAWCAVSYVPFLWHPMVAISDPGSVDWFQKDMQVDRAEFREENRKAAAEGRAQARGLRGNPVYLPAPHRVARALVTAFRTPPQRSGDPWLHESLGHSIRIIALGFLLSAAFGVPLGVLAGTFALASRLSEPFVDFIRYMPAPVFGALCVAILGIDDAPKVAIIFIGTFFQMALVVANTTRGLPLPLLEAAQTLGARRRQLLFNVVVPGVLPLLYRDMRILLGWAWTYLIVAELIGASSGISFFIYQQAKYRNYDNVYAAIILIGLIGLGTDLFLKALGRKFFPWEKADP